MWSNRRWIAWWYAAIAVAFLLLAINFLILHGKPWLAGVRLVIAAGFGVLSWLEFSARGRGKS